jgi:hypothetical protein
MDEEHYILLEMAEISVPLLISEDVISNTTIEVYIREE